MRAKDFTQIRHADLSQQGNYQTKHKRGKLKRLAQVGRDACTEKISQRGKEKVEGTGEFDQFTILD